MQYRHAKTPGGTFFFASSPASALGLLSQRNLFRPYPPCRRQVLSIVQTVFGLTLAESKGVSLKNGSTPDQYFTGSGHQNRPFSSFQRSPSEYSLNTCVGERGVFMKGLVFFCLTFGYVVEFQ
jgi:hypothetical protein